MPEPNSLGSRERSVALARAADSSRAEVARRFWFSKRTLYTWLERDKSEGTVTPHPHCGTGGTAVDAAGLVILRSIVKQQNDRMLEEYVALFAEETGI